MFRHQSRQILIVLYGAFWILGLFLFSAEAAAQNTTTVTMSATATNLVDNPTFGCPACAAIPDLVVGPGTIFPNTSTPLFSGDPSASALPAIIASALPPNNQFGVGIPPGDSGTPLFHSTPFDLSEGGMVLSFRNELSSLPAAGGRSHTFTSQIAQTTPGGHTSGSGLDQPFSILFSISSLTDPDGNLIGTATGTFTQEIEGVVTQGTIQFDSTNGFSGTNLHQ